MAPRNRRSAAGDSSDSSAIEFSEGEHMALPEEQEREVGEQEEEGEGDGEEVTKTRLTKRRKVSVQKNSSSLESGDIGFDETAPQLRCQLARIEIENFKSYRGKQVVGPFKAGFQTVIGPNGSGKSNIMDAISFVLGVRSRDLRSESLTHLIYRPTNLLASSEESSSLSSQQQTEEEPGPQRDAKVTLIFADHNTGAEYSFSRTVTSAGASRYGVGSRTHTFKEFAKALFDRCGINLHAQNFLVFQGHVANAKTPQEISELIDIVSGSRLLKEEYEAALARKIEAEESTIESFQKKKDMVLEKSHMKAQKNEAEEYANLEAERKVLLEDKVLLDLMAGEERLKLADNLREQLQDELLKLQEEEGKSLKKDREDIKRLRAAAAKELSQAEQTIRKHKAQADQSATAVTKLQKEEKQLDSRKASTQKSLDKIAAERKAQEATIKRLQSELSSTEAALASFAAAREQRRSSGIQLDEQQMQEYTRLNQDVFTRTAAIQGKLGEIRRSLSSNGDKQKLLKSNESDLVQVQKRLQADITKNSQHLEKVALFIETTTKQKAQVEREIADVERHQVQKAEAQQSLTEDLVKLDQELTEARGTAHESERQRKTKQAIQTLTQKFDGVRGSLLSLCNPRQPRYQSAMTVAIGAANLDAVVVDTSRTARECVQYLKQSRSIALTFLPLDTLQASEFPLALRQQCSQHTGSFVTARPAIDVLDFDPSVAKAFQYVCRDTLVCDTIDEARQLVFRNTPGVKVRRVVTLSGALVQKALMTGGVGGDSSAAAARWDQKRLDELIAKRESVVQLLVEVGQSLRAPEKALQLPKDLKVLEDRIQLSTRQKEDSDVQQTKYRADLAKVEADLAAIRSSLSEAVREATALEQTATQLEQEVSAVSDEVYADFCDRVGVETIREFESSIRYEQTQNDASKGSELQAAKTKLDEELRYEQERDLETPLSNFKKSLVELDDKLNQIREEVKVAKLADDAAQQEIAKLQDEAKQKDLATKQADAALSSADKALKEHTAKEGETKKRISTEESEIEKLRSQRHDLRRKCEVEDILLPRKPGAADSQSFTSQVLATQPDSQALEAVFDADAAWVQTINFSRIEKMLPSGLLSSTSDKSNTDAAREAPLPKRGAKGAAAKSAATKKGAGKNGTKATAPATLSDELLAFFKSKHAELDARFNEINAQLARMEPNLKAVHLFDEVNDRFNETAEEFENARSMSTAAQQEFQRIKERRQTLFEDAFRVIERNIDHVYQEITQSQQSAANLIAEVDDEPYLGGIQYRAIPPTKRFHGQTALSGGEQTLATLALLFAVYSYRPSPFFVLDEIDAHLDPPNVKRVVNFVRKRSRAAADPKAEGSATQFIVITLNQTVAQASDAMVGVYKNMDEGGASATLTVDLQPFPHGRS